MAIKIKFIGKENEKMNAGGCKWNGSEPESIVQEVDDEQAAYMLDVWPNYFEVAGAKKADHAIPNLKKDVKAESYETKDVKASEETKSEPEPEPEPEPAPAPKKTTKKKGKR